MSASALTVLDGTGASKTLATFTDAAGNQRYQVSGDSSVAHYSASKSNLTPVATPTAAFILPGNGTTTVRLKKIILNGVATAAGSMIFSIKKNSDAGTLGSAVLTALTSVPMDSTAAAASSAVSSVGTANYGTLPALVGPIVSGELNMGPAGTSLTGPQVYEFGTGGRQAVVLRGTSQSVTVDFLGATVPSGGKVDCTFEWAEDAS